MKLTKVTHDNTIEDNYGFDTLPSVLVVSDIDQAEAFYSQLLGMPGLSPTAYFQAPAETSGEVCPDDGDWGVRDSENTSNLFSKKIVGTLLAPPHSFRYLNIASSWWFSLLCFIITANSND